MPPSPPHLTHTHTHTCSRHAQTLSEWHPMENKHEGWRSNIPLSSLWLAVDWQMDSLFDFAGRLSLWLLLTVLEMSCLWDGRRPTTPTLEPIMSTTIPVSWTSCSPPYAYVGVKSVCCGILWLLDGWNGIFLLDVNENMALRVETPTDSVGLLY